MTVRVLLADDHAALRAGLGMLLNAQPDFDVVGEAGDGAEAVRLTRETAPDVVILDLSMGPHSGLDAIPRIRDACAGARVLVLSMHTDASYVRMALAAGAMGYVAKSAADSELLSAVRAVAHGRTFIDLAIGCLSDREEALGLSATEHERRTFVPLRALSRRESEVLGRIAQGFTNLQIAGQLGLSVKSVETYRARLLVKLNARSRAELVRFALATGMVTPEKLIQAE